MQPLLTTSTFILLITVILCFVAGPILFAFSRNQSVNNRWLAAYYVTIGYGLLVAFLLYSRLITFRPWLYTYRTGYISGFLLMPFSFFYIRSLMQQKKFRTVDLIHFLPVTIFIIDFIPYYLRSDAYKIAQVTIDAQQLNTTWGQFSQGWLGIGRFYVPFRILLTTIYWIWEVRMILRSGKMKHGNNLLAENPGVMKWARIFCGSQLLFFIPYYANAVFGDQQNSFFVAHTLLAITVAITIIALIMQPAILYGLKGIVIPSSQEQSRELEGALQHTSVDGETLTALPTLTTTLTPAVPEKVTNEVYVSGQKLHTLAEQVSDHIQQQRFYLNKGCTSADLAREMNLQPYLLSAVINQVFKTNFNDFLNSYRVDHARSLILNGEARLLTLEALSEQCGFNNRNSFTIAFKKHTGQTPSSFIKQTEAGTN